MNKDQDAKKENYDAVADILQMQRKQLDLAQKL